VYIKSNCGNSIVLGTVNCWIHCIPSVKNTFQIHVCDHFATTKTALKLDVQSKKVQILEFSFSVKFISETIRDNLSKYYQKLLAQYQFREKNG
jgi:hypothetical protein